jgi:5-formyltetrahydrofolate cyclo-ligase
MPPADKLALRRDARRRRRQLTGREAAGAADRIARLAWRLPSIAKARHIACYLPAGFEVDTRPLIKSIWRRGRRLYLPVLDGSRLLFRFYREGDPLVRNRHGILEPHGHRAERRAPATLDVVLAPLVAFDEDGTRLGTGGGYYDRTLAFLASRQRFLRPRFVGIAYRCQQLARLPVDAWDVRLDAVITDGGVRRFRRDKRST